MVVAVFHEVAFIKRSVVLRRCKPVRLNRILGIIISVSRHKNARHTVDNRKQQGIRLSGISLEELHIHNNALVIGTLYQFKELCKTSAADDRAFTRRDSEIIESRHHLTVIPDIDR